MKFELDLDF